LTATTTDDRDMKTAVISDTLDAVVRDLHLLPSDVRGSPWVSHLCSAEDMVAPPGSPIGGFEVLIDEPRGFGMGFPFPPCTGEKLDKLVST
jgi:hypothetical protein